MIRLNLINVTMKKNFISIIALFFLFSCFGNHRKNSLSEANIKGKVKILITFQYDASEKFGQAQKENLQFTYTDFYDEQGKIIEKNILNNFQGNEFVEKIIYEYDEQGNALGKHYEPNGDLYGTYKYIYDEKGNLIEYHEFNSNGEQLDKTVTQYNNNGEKISTYDYDRNDSIEKVQTYSFEDNSKRMIVKQDKQAIKLIFTYDDNGNEISYSEVYENDKVCQIIVSKYDNFDEQNNWTNRIMIYKGKVDRVFEREIQYFDNVQVNSKIRSSGKELNTVGNEISRQTLCYLSRLKEYPTSSMKSGKEAAAYASCAYNLVEFNKRLNEYPPTEIISGSEPATYASCSINLTEFTKRLHEFPSSEVKSGSEPAAYASCSYNIAEFLKRLLEYPSTEIKSGIEPAIYARSNYPLTEFIKRLHEYPSSNISSGVEPAFYALSEHKLCN